MFEPINKRIKSLPADNKSSLMRSVDIIAPVFVYYFLSMFATYGAAYLVKLGDPGSSLFVAHPVMSAAIIRITAVIIAVLPLIPLFIGERPIMAQKDEKPLYILLTVLLAVALAMFLNMLFYKTGFSTSSETFEETAARQLSLPVGLGVFVYGIITPITEEIVYRGVVYNRVRRYFNLPMALIFSSLLFGIAHGNRVQLVYGFLMGVVIGYIYERFGSFIYPVIFHCAANTAVYIVMTDERLKEIVAGNAGFAISAVCAVTAVALIATIKRKEAKPASEV